MLYVCACRRVLYIIYIYNIYIYICGDCGRYKASTNTHEIGNSKSHSTYDKRVRKGLYVAHGFQPQRQMMLLWATCDSLKIIFHHAKKHGIEICVTQNLIADQLVMTISHHDNDIWGIAQQKKHSKARKKNLLSPSWKDASRDGGSTGVIKRG